MANPNPIKSRLHLAKPQDFDRVAAMVTAFHAETGIQLSDEQRANALIPLLEGCPLGVIYVIGPRTAPVGYLAISFGWSIEMGGIDGYVDEFWIRPKVRRRGMGGEALAALVPALREAGVRALHLEADRDTPVPRLYKRLGFALREQNCLMTAMLVRD